MRLRKLLRSIILNALLVVLTISNAILFVFAFVFEVGSKFFTWLYMKNSDTKEGLKLKKWSSKNFRNKLYIIR